MPTPKRTTRPALKVTDIGRELGSMTTRLEDLDRRITNIERDVKEIRNFVLSAKGSWRALLIVAAASSTFTALLLKTLPLLKHL